MAKPIKVQVLDRAIEIISDPNCWCRMSGHMKIDGVDKYCAQGAIWKAIKEMMPDWPNNPNAFKLSKEMYHMFGMRYEQGPDAMLWVTNDQIGREAVIERMKAKSKELVNGKTAQ